MHKLKKLNIVKIVVTEYERDKLLDKSFIGFMDFQEQGKNQREKMKKKQRRLPSSGLLA